MRASMHFHSRLLLTTALAAVFLLAAACQSDQEKIAGFMERGKAAVDAEKHGLVISSYSLLHRDIEILKKIDWAGVILDEAQNIKNPKTKQARSARTIKSGYRVAMTGTPIENNVSESSPGMSIISM